MVGSSIRRRSGFRNRIRANSARITHPPLNSPMLREKSLSLKPKPSRIAFASWSRSSPPAASSSASRRESRSISACCCSGLVVEESSSLAAAIRVPRAIASRLAFSTSCNSEVPVNSEGSCLKYPAVAKRCWVTDPASAKASPARMSNRVVFPDPLAPIRAIRSPSAMENVNPLNNVRSE